MKESRKLLNKAGAQLYWIVIAFSLIKDWLIIPIISLIWKLTLMTTPDGFISNANIGNTLLKSPWIIVIGAVVLGLFLIFTMWQVSATVYGVAYAYEGRTPKALELLKISLNEVVNGTKGKNWKLLLYTIIILPLTNIFHASSMIGTFVIPEYIMDFIMSKIILHVVYILLMIISIYFALRLFYVLPSFFLKVRDFEKASKESFSFTRKGALRNGLKLIIYGMIESVRLAILPVVIVTVSCIIAYSCVADNPYASEVFAAVVIKMSRMLFGTICGVLVYLSSMCYVINDYYVKCRSHEVLEEIKLPEIRHEGMRRLSGRAIQFILAVIGTAVIVTSYLDVLGIVEKDPESIAELIHKPVVIAHKGYSSKAPENTMDAFELADETENAKYIELDVWSSKDGIPVVIHNETITAATGQSGRVYDYTYEELQEIPAPYAMSPKDFPDARIPRLEDVIAKYADTTPILIEIKGYNQDALLPSKIVALMEKYNCTDTSMIHSGNYAALKAVKLCNPEIQCGLIQAIVTGNSYDLPYADFLSVEHSFVTPNMINQLHIRGKDLYVWTVNYDEPVDELRTMGVDGFITDYPDKIAGLIEEEISPLESIANTVSVDNYDSESAKKEFEEGDY